jgi:hypothetical protein
MEPPAMKPRCFVFHPPITAPSRLRISFFTGFGNTKTWTLGVVLTQSVTNVGPWDHQGKKVSFACDHRRDHSNHRRSAAISSSFRLTHYLPRLARCLSAAYIPSLARGAAGDGG